MIGQLVVSLLALASFVPRITPPAPIVAPAPAPAFPPHIALRPLGAQVDDRVLANLLSDAPTRSSDLPLSVTAGEITHCESGTCAVPLTIRTSIADGPVKLAFAVANQRGELSDVHHALCGAGSCKVSLVLERGQNTISIGVVDVLSQTTAYARVRVDASGNRSASPGKSEWF